MASLQDLLTQRNDIMNKRDSTRQQFEQSSVGVTNDDALRYLNEKVGAFQPLQEERRNLMSQAAQTLPTQIQEYVTNQQNGQQGASSLTALNSIFKNQANTRQQANLIGDQIDTARGKLGDIASSSLQLLGQKQNSLKYLLGQQESDLSRQDGLVGQEQARLEVEKERARAAAEKERARAAASMYAQQNQGYGYNQQNQDYGYNLQNQGQSAPINVQEAPKDPSFMSGLAALGANINKNENLKGFLKASPYGDWSKITGFVGNGKPLSQDLKEIGSSLFNNYNKYMTGRR